MTLDVTETTFKSVFDDTEGSYEFDVAAQSRYQSVSLFAVLSVVLGLLSILTAFGWLFAFIPVVGILLSLWAQHRILRSPETTTGMRVAQVGLWLSVAMWLVGTIGWLYVQAREVPHGYKPLTFKMMQAEGKGATMVPPEIEQYDGKRVYLKGYMYPGRQTIRLKQFLLVPTKGHCKFCMSAIPPEQIIEVELAGDLTTDYVSYATGVGGRLRIDKEVAKGKRRGLPYRIEADYLH